MDRSKIFEEFTLRNKVFDDIIKESKTKRKFIIWSEYGELLDLADYLANVENQEVKMCTSPEYSKIGQGIVDKLERWEYLNYLGKGYIWVIDGCSDGKFQDWLRSKGEAVFGGSEAGDEMENNRQKNQEWFIKAGFQKVESENFKTIDDALKFLQKNMDKKWVLKQNGNAPKALNHIGKFDNNEDMIFHLEELKKSWNESQCGSFDCDLMEKVEGLEVAASVFFNGKDYLKNSQGKVVGYLNFEEKKECDGNTGETTGEMGTSFIGCGEDNELFKEILMKPEILKGLRKMNFRGVFDINCIKTDKGIVALEPTMRPGIPATSYEFIEGLNMRTCDMLAIVANGEDKPISIKQGSGMVMVIAAKPYPIEAPLEDCATSIGEKLWILDNGKPTDEFTNDQREHIHLENFEKDEYYKVATKNGYLFTCTYSGKTIKKTRENLIKYIKENVYISGMKYRCDIGERAEEYENNNRNNPA